VVPLSKQKCLATAGIDCYMVSPPLLGAMEDCSIVRGPQLQRLCRQNCCMSGQRRMFGSMWSVVCLSHPCTLLKPFSGLRCHLAGTLVGSNDTLC